jgi:NAD(P)-dependent dehydrogenase (short-subunit alcohol dehydrogenase family)
MAHQVDTLVGRVALVTGANRGIGRAIALELARLGAATLVGGRDGTLAAEAAEEIRSEGLDAAAMAIDVTDDSSVLEAKLAIERAHGRLDMLVNNAAIKLEHHPSLPSEAALDDVRRTLETNVLGTIRVTQAMLPLLLTTPHPRIVNLTSGLGSLTWASTVGTKYQSRPLMSYNTSKAAVNMVTVLFANEFRETALRVNAVDPGPVNTPMTRGTATREPEDGARPVIDALLLPDDGPTGCYFDERGTVPW